MTSAYALSPQSRAHTSGQTGEHPPQNPRRWSLARAILGWDKPRSPGLRSFLRAGLRRYLTWNRRLLLDPWLRYYPAVSILRGSIPLGRSRILDVGSGSTGLACFLRMPVVAVDVQFSSPDLARFPSPIQPVRASATNLPFREASFDAVVSIDMLEHLAQSDRPEAIRELFRVARRIVIVGFPFGASSARFDEEALREERSKGIRLEWREEHVRHGIPGDEIHREVISAAREVCSKSVVAWFGQEGLLGLRLRWKLQSLVTKDSRMYGMLFTPIYWLHARGRRLRAYRRIYVSKVFVA